MTRDRMNGMIIGLFYITAAVTSIIAVVLYEPVLSEEWYLAAADGAKTKVLIGVVHDLLLIVSAIGTAVMLFPYLRRWNEHAALGYLCFRFMEAVFIIGFSLLSACNARNKKPPAMRVEGSRVLPPRPFR
ncbi:DUF4386 domain-containing protein [Marinicrinis lubricantis]|uniref:DUF4386 domain-containing protein n=1 Tax=Marinicrinis lubricantis TaxID=2086470 RepID=A0ABW1IVU8_9BACL